MSADAWTAADPCACPRCGRDSCEDPSHMPPDDHASTSRADDWPQPAPIQSELPPVHAFSEDLLPVSFRPLVCDVAERMQVPMDYPAVVIVLCLAGVVSRRVVVQPKAEDTSWVIVPNLWGGIVAPPGFLKSPVIQTATRALHQMQTEWRVRHEAALKEIAISGLNSRILTLFEVQPHNRSASIRP